MIMKILGTNKLSLPIKCLVRWPVQNMNLNFNFVKKKKKNWIFGFYTKKHVEKWSGCLRKKKKKERKIQKWGPPDKAHPLAVWYGKQGASYSLVRSVLTKAYLGPLTQPSSLVLDPTVRPKFDIQLVFLKKCELWEVLSYGHSPNIL